MGIDMAKPLKKALTEKQLRRRLKEAFGDNMTEWSREHGVTPQSVSAYMRKVQPAGNKIPAIFGLVPITVFVPQGDPLDFRYPSRAAIKPDKSAQKFSKQARKSLKEVERAEKKTKKKKKGKKR
jgi:hypothetical protein